MTLRFDDAVFAAVPRKQSQQTGATSDTAVFTDGDLGRIAVAPAAEAIVKSVVKRRFSVFAEHLVRRICNAGPHVVDVSVKTAARSDADGEPDGAVVTMRSPIIKANTYGDAVHVMELGAKAVGPIRAGAPVVFVPTPSLGGRLKSWLAAEWAKTASDNWGVPYDGPRGWRDAG